MINICDISINIPSISQFVAIVLTITSIFAIFLVLEKRSTGKKLHFYILLYFMGPALFIFFWSLIFGDPIRNLNDVWQNLIKLGNKPMYMM